MKEVPLKRLTKRKYCDILFSEN